MLRYRVQGNVKRFIVKLHVIDLMADSDRVIMLLTLSDISLPESKICGILIVDEDGLMKRLRLVAVDELYQVTLIGGERRANFKFIGGNDEDTFLAGDR